MKIFKEPNTANNWKCPICGKSTEKPVTLIGISGTEEGGNIRAEQFHVDCIELIYFKGRPPAEGGIIAQKFWEK
jgi:hypothetical protein